MSRSSTLLYVWLTPVALLLLAGCAPKDVKLESVQLVDDRAWGMPDPAPVDGYAVLIESRTRGVFPSAVAVAQLVPGGRVSGAEPEDRDPSWSVASLPPEQATYWNTLMTHVPDVREMVVLDEESTERPDVDLNGLLSTAQRRGAGLCLAYGVTSADPAAYRMGGVLFDASSRQMLAVLRAEAGPGDFETRSPDRHSTDLRHRDASYLCARKLQAHLRDCLLDLIGRDNPATTQPSPWAGTPSQQFPPAEIIVLPRHTP